MKNLTVYGNTIEFPGETIPSYKSSESGRIAILGQYYNESRIFGNTWLTTALTPADFEPFKINQSKISTITIEHNRVEEVKE